MKVILYSRSAAFCALMSSRLNDSVECRSQLASPDIGGDNIYLLHHSSLGGEALSWLYEHAAQGSVVAGVCADKPQVGEMLQMIEAGAKAYCNAFMQPLLYRQMFRLLDNGQSWFPPQMMKQTFNLARQAIAAGPQTEGDDLQDLTPREQDIARAASIGKSNLQIAQQFTIAESTVKTHMTNIFKKLELKDRVALVLYLKRA